MAKAKVLIVDDNEEIYELMEKQLTSAGFEVENLKEAEGIVEHTRYINPDIILMDIVLPNMDGADAVRMLQEYDDTRDIPVVFLSGIISEVSGGKPEIKVGDRIYPALSKPCTSEVIIGEINKSLGL